MTRGGATVRLAEISLGDEAYEELRAVLESGWLTQGPRVAAFEEEVAAMCGAVHAVATSSGTTALHLALAAMGIGAGDEVAVADFTFPATGNVVLQQGARLKLIDVEPATFNVSAETVAAAVGPDTRLVIPVDAFGLPADYPAIEAELAGRGIHVLADAACSLGGGIGERRAGTFGTASCFSFHPRKVLTTGEGGMVVTSDDALAARLRRLRNHGSERASGRLRFVEAGFNYRMSDVHAALGLAQVPRHAEVVARRTQLAAALSALLAGTQGVTAPSPPPGFHSSWQAYVIRLDGALDRDAVVDRLREVGVEATIGTYAMHAEPAFGRECGTRPGDLPGSWEVARRSLALPLHQALDSADLERIAEALDSAVRAA